MISDLGVMNIQRVTGAVTPSTYQRLPVVHVVHLHQSLVDRAGLDGNELLEKFNALIEYHAVVKVTDCDLFEIEHEFGGHELAAGIGGVVSHAVPGVEALNLVDSLYVTRAAAIVTDWHRSVVCNVEKRSQVEGCRSSFMQRST